MTAYAWGAVNILHANAHSALYLDMRDVCRRLGIRVYSWSVSSHLWRVGHDVPVEAARALAGWSDVIDAEFCDRFVHRYRPHLTGFDAFVVDHPVCFAPLFEHTGRPVIANSTTRYDLGVAGSPSRSAWLDATLRRMYGRGQLIPMSNNLGDRAYASARLGFDWPNLPSLCEYTGASYHGEKPQWLRASSQRSPLPPPYDWKDLGAYRGIVHTPYNCSQMSIIEHYASGLPIVVPSEARLLDMALADLEGAMSQVSLRRVLGLPPGEGMDDFRSPGALRQWVALSDFYDDEWMPGVVRAEDPIEESFLASLDSRAISGRIARFLPERRRRIMAGWSDVINRVATEAA
jgi:hypothetical protein